MRIALVGSNYCGQYDPIPDPHEFVWMPLGPTLDSMFSAAGIDASWPDVVVFILAETLPLPVDVETCPCPTVAIVVDWEAWSDALMAHAPGLDCILADQSGVDAMSKLFPGKCRTFVPVGNFGQVRTDLARRPISEREWDVTFVGGLAPSERFPGRVEGLRHLYPLCDEFRVRIVSKLDHDDFLAAMCDSKILYNHAAMTTQQGINARNFEAGECRAVVMGEQHNAALREFFTEDELLFYDYEGMADSVRAILDAPETAQAMADRYAAKVKAPLMPRLLASLQGIVDDNMRTRTERSLHDALVGLVTGFGNWGDAAHRMPHTLDMMLQASRAGAARYPDDATLRNIAGVAIAEVAVQLGRLGHADKASSIVSHPDFDPIQHWRRAARLDATFAAPLYNLGRYYAASGDETRALDFLNRARRCLDAHGGGAMARPCLFYPVWSARATGLDRTLSGSYNTARFACHDDDERSVHRARLLRWRIEECIGDLAARRGSTDQALKAYAAAEQHAPELSTEALRKALAIGMALEDRKAATASLAKLCALNPLDAAFRQQLRDAYAADGRVEATLNEEIRLLTKAIPTPRAFERPSLDVI